MKDDKIQYILPEVSKSLKVSFGELPCPISLNKMCSYSKRIENEYDLTFVCTYADNLDSCKYLNNLKKHLTIKQ